mgnify:CR=1 FL=1
MQLRRTTKIITRRGLHGWVWIVQETFGETVDSGEQPTQLAARKEARQFRDDYEAKRLAQAEYES